MNVIELPPNTEKTLELEKGVLYCIKNVKIIQNILPYNIINVSLKEINNQNNGFLLRYCEFIQISTGIIYVLSKKHIALIQVSNL